MTDRPPPPDRIGVILRPCRAALAACALFSAFVNLLMLTGPLFMLQVYDRVLPARSPETLAALFLLVLFLFALLALADVARTRILARCADHLQIQLDLRVFPALLGPPPGGAPPAPPTPLRHIAALTEGVSRRAAIQRSLLPVLLGTLADSADPDAGLLSYRQVSDALSGTPWYLRLLRDESAVAERMAHGLEVRTGAVNHHDRHAAARPNIDDVELPTCDLDQSALTRVEPIERNNPGLRDQRQNSQRHHQAYEDHRRNPDCFLHARTTILRQIGFGGKSRAVPQVRPIRQPAAASAVLRFRPGSTVPAGKPSGCCWRSRCPRPGNAVSYAG